MTWERTHAIGRSEMGRGWHKPSRSAMLKAGHKLRDVKEASRAKQSGRQKWCMGKEVGKPVRQEGEGWGDRALNSQEC